MRAPMAVAATIFLSACAVPPATDTTGQQLSVDGRSYQIGQLTNSTWIATQAGIGQPRAITPSSRAALLDAIAKSSGCKVTDSDLSREGLQLDAQVDCGSRLDHPASAARQDFVPQSGRMSTQ